MIVDYERDFASSAIPIAFDNMEYSYAHLNNAEPRKSSAPNGVVAKGVELDASQAVQRMNYLNQMKPVSTALFENQSITVGAQNQWEPASKPTAGSAKPNGTRHEADMPTHDFRQDNGHCTAATAEQTDQPFWIKLPDEPTGKTTQADSATTRPHPTDAIAPPRSEMPPALSKTGSPEVPAQPSTERCDAAGQPSMESAELPDQASRDKAKAAALPDSDSPYEYVSYGVDAAGEQSPALPPAGEVDGADDTAPTAARRRPTASLLLDDGHDSTVASRLSQSIT